MTIHDSATDAYEDKDELAKLAAERKAAYLRYSPMMVRFEWGERHTRFYADSWLDVEAVLDDMLDEDKKLITRITWPDEEE